MLVDSIAICVNCKTYDYSKVVIKLTVFCEKPKQMKIVTIHTELTNLYNAYGFMLFFFSNVYAYRFCDCNSEIFICINKYSFLSFNYIVYHLLYCLKNIFNLVSYYKLYDERN